jgi:hypothetical protein
MKLQSENSRVFIEAQANAVAEPAATDKDHIM